MRIIWNNAYTGAVKKGGGFSSEARQHFYSQLKRKELPFLTLDYCSDLQEELDGYREYLSGFRHMLVLGIGGSALGTKALQKAFLPAQDRPGHEGPWLWIADNVCPEELSGYLCGLPPQETVVVVVSKSGGTLETVSQYFFVRRWLQDSLPRDWQDHLVMVTDPEKGFLRQETEQYGLRSLPVPEKLGGRYSVLSAVGLLPAMFMGLDCRELVNGALELTHPLVNQSDFLQSPYSVPGLARWARDLVLSGYPQLIFFVYIPNWKYFGEWFAQLWAESLGKNGTGSTPVPAVGVTDQHSLQQLFLDGPRDKGCLFLTAEEMPQGPRFSSSLPEKWDWLRGKSFGDLLQAEALGTRMAMVENGVPMVHMQARSPSVRTAGKLIALLEGMTYLTGLLLEINPLDQPAVELGKRLANAELGAEGLKEEKDRLARFKGQKQDKEVL